MELTSNHPSTHFMSSPNTDTFEATALRITSCAKRLGINTEQLLTLAARSHRATRRYPRNLNLTNANRPAAHPLHTQSPKPPLPASQQPCHNQQGKASTKGGCRVSIDPIIDATCSLSSHRFFQLIKVDGTRQILVGGKIPNHFSVHDDHRRLLGKLIASGQVAIPGPKVPILIVN